MKGLLFTYALTYGGAVVSLINPFYGLLVYCCFSIIKPDALWYWSVPRGNYSRIVAIAFLLGWALSGFGDWKLGRAKPILISIVGFYIWAMLSTLGCEQQPWGYLESTGKILIAVVAGLTLIRSMHQIRQLAWCITLSLGYVAYDLNMSYFGGNNRLFAEGFGGMDGNSFTIQLVAGVGLAFFLGLSETVWWKKLIPFACAAFMTHAIMFSWSRGGYLGLIVVGLISFILIPKSSGNVALFACGAVLALIMAGPPVIKEFKTTFTDENETSLESDGSRMHLWIACLQMAADRPLLGVGPGHFGIRIPEYPTSTGFVFKRGKQAHSTWLQVLAELGLPALGCLLAFYGLAIWRSFLFLRSESMFYLDEFSANVPRMLCASLAGFVIASQFVTSEGVELSYYVTLIGAGFLKVQSQLASVPYEPISSAGPPPCLLPEPGNFHAFGSIREYCGSEVGFMLKTIETPTAAAISTVDNASWDLIIRPKRHLLDVNLKEIWDYRDLIYMFVKRDVVTVYKQTILGPIWFFVQPIMTMLVYVVVFGNIANIGTDGIPQPLFYLAGIILWNYFDESFKKTSVTFRENAHIFGKVYFPRLIVPLSLVVSGLIKFVIQFILFLAVLLYFWQSRDDISPNVWVISTVYLLLLMAAMGLGFGIIFSSLTTKYRDLTFLIQFGVQLAMYATPIIYPMSLLSERWQSVMWWNPIAHIVETFKYGFLGAGNASIAGLAYTTIFTLVVLSIGIVIFNRTEQTFMDTV